ncbi:toll/interleukin-1 receptor domain-containing protein [Mucilaginibacter sp. HMF5004]|uniref:toll/interleukin-1 receptor domain-containing protein n=1 Tax=Mucilaginibacter rivuli TaxID=2857527 RepID=UPI001C5D21F1|nr:toll/interleukin-1 receptor domain-containing protein [Mucilaginibacter rivuli]MBW4888654.1 toll/interleukin-1 receptor domain-containing protein [Mucilaginibacter rivuli]
MPPKKQSLSAHQTNTEEQSITHNQPLVFISHDTRDAELAEEFSNLLKSASAGALKSFRSSDKKGAQGIEYGQEWYPTIMEKIKAATDVVCLLTQHSIDRPWILYEAGVAKGAVDKKVIGITLGIPISKAISGPFALFQNNDGDAASLVKLVIDMVVKVPGLDPDRSMVEMLVDKFVAKVTEITGNMKAVNGEAEQSAVADQNSAAKLFEEVKIMFDSLPARLENRLDPEFRRKRRKFHPMMFEEMMHFGFEEEEPGIGLLIFISLYRDELPWFYEIGMETYRGLKIAKTIQEKEKLLRTFDRATEMLSHPFTREFYGESKEAYILIKESRHLFRHWLERVRMDKRIEK